MSPDLILAAVDVGTNSLHLVVARTTDAGGFEVLTREREMVRLGRGGADMTVLSDDAIDRAVAALDRFRRIADSRGATMRAVATSAVREADNREVLLERARTEAGVEVEVVSGSEEARLIHLGVLQGLELYDRRRLLCDVGGGSTELLIGEHDAVVASTSVKLGSVRLTNRFFAGSKLHPSAVASCRSHVRSTLAAFAKVTRQSGFEVAVGSSGSIEQVLRLARGLEGAEPLRTLNGARLTRKQVSRVVEALVVARRDGTTSSLPDLDPKREDIALAGALVLEGVVESCGVKEMLISDYALREGVLLDTVSRHAGGPRLHLRDVARRSVLDLVRRSDDDPSHAQHVAHLALCLFDATTDQHGLGADVRDLLEAGALLANVGMAVSHSRHHRHSYYLIRNSDRLVGFTDPEIEMIALIARYHRKSAPKDSHPEWTCLDAQHQRVVRVGAGLLRVAVGLDRTRSSAVSGVEVHVEGDRLVIEPVPSSPTVDLSLELWAAQERSGMLAEALGMEVVVSHPGD